MRSIIIILASCFCFLSILYIFVYLVDPDQDNKYSYDFKYSFGGGYGLYTKLKTKLKNQPSELIFGSSRSRLISNKVLKSKNQILNMHIVYGNPIAIYDFLISLNDKQIENIKKVYVLLDTHVFCGSNDINKYFEKSLTKRTLDQIQTFDLSKLIKAYRKLIINLMPKYTFEENYAPSFYVLNSGETILLRRPEWDGINQEALHSTSFSLETIKFLKLIDSWMVANKKKIIYFTPPHTLNDFIAHADESFLTTLIIQRIEILKNLDGFYDFSLVPELMKDNSLWEDSFHLNKKGLDYLFNKINWDKYYVQGKEYINVTQNKINEFNIKYNLSEELSYENFQRAYQDSKCNSK